MTLCKIVSPRSWKQAGQERCCKTRPEFNDPVGSLGVMDKLQPSLRPTTVRCRSKASGRSERIPFAIVSAREACCSPAPGTTQLGSTSFREIDHQSEFSCALPRQD
uniref:Uncharacterized protein n=1 Tax=Anopheles coluzzii TaxID=1518534 RepID=A0A8W7PYP2_ANOCL